MAEFSKIEYEGTTWKVKDKTAREAIAALEGGSYFLGVTETKLVDQSTANPIVIEGKSVRATNGNIAVYERKEFIYNGFKWIEFGDLSALRALAYKDSAQAAYTPAGTISEITPRGTIGEITPAGAVDTSGTSAESETVMSLSDAGELGALEYDGAEEALSLSFGRLPEAEEKTVLKNIAVRAVFAGEAVTPTFTGEAVTPTFTGEAVTPTFAGEAVTPAFTGKTETIVVS